MIECEQFSGQSVFQHGQSVRACVSELIGCLRNDSPLEGWRIPDWIWRYKAQLLSHLHDQETVELYTVYHDIGKPFCREVDEQGKAHFPDHAEVSRQIFLEVTSNEVVANLIGWDMDLHVLTADELSARFSVWSARDAATLLLVALAELHSNARFLDPSGIESQSFKIKWKRLDRRGLQVCKHYFEEVK